MLPRLEAGAQVQAAWAARAAMFDEEGFGKYMASLERQRDGLPPLSSGQTLPRSLRIQQIEAQGVFQVRRSNKSYDPFGVGGK